MDPGHCDRADAQEKSEGVHGRERVCEVERVLIFLELAAQQHEALLALREALHQLQVALTRELGTAVEGELEGLGAPVPLG